VKVWGYDEGFCYYVGVGHSGDISQARISPDQNSIVTVGDEGAIFIWSMPVLALDTDPSATSSAAAAGVVSARPSAYGGEYKEETKEAIRPPVSASTTSARPAATGSRVPSGSGRPAGAASTSSGAAPPASGGRRPAGGAVPPLGRPPSGNNLPPLAGGATPTGARGTPKGRTTSTTTTGATTVARPVQQPRVSSVRQW
jgi:hypothetical protein